MMKEQCFQLESIVDQHSSNIACYILHLVQLYMTPKGPKHALEIILKRQ